MRHFTPHSIDWQPLLAPASSWQLGATLRRYPGAEGPRRFSPAMRVLIALVVVAFVAVAAAVLANALLYDTDALSVWLVVVPVVIIACALAWGIRALYPRRRTRRERSYRLITFAEANGLTFVSTVANPPLPGIIFDASRTGPSARATDVMRVVAPRFIEVGNFEYYEGHDRQRTIFNWGYAAIKVDNLLPNIVLDARSNNTVFGSNLGAFPGGKPLSLEGNFDTFFTLYCPNGYEQDALYLFTPDVLQILMHHGSGVDIELVDNWVMFYSNDDLSTTDARTWSWLFELIDALMTKLAQWERWRDDRLAGVASLPAAPQWGAVSAGNGQPAATNARAFVRQAPGVASIGRRLQHRSWSAGDTVWVLLGGVGLAAGVVLVQLLMR